MRQGIIGEFGENKKEQGDLQSELSQAIDDLMNASKMGMQMSPEMGKELGIAEAMRSHGQMRTPLAMFSRSFAGTINKTTIVCLPGSTKGVKESLEAILPAIFHANKMLNGEGH